MTTHHTSSSLAIVALSLGLGALPATAQPTPSTPIQVDTPVYVPDADVRAVGLGVAPSGSTGPCRVERDPRVDPGTPGTMGSLHPQFHPAKRE